MGKLHSLKISVTLYLLIHLLRFSSLSLLSSAYTLPDDYFINCGSASDISLRFLNKSRNFIGDGKRSRSFGFTGQSSSTVADTNSPTSSVYQTARIFHNPSSYELRKIANVGTYMVRLHFCAFTSPSTNLSHAQFDVLATGYPKNGVSLLSNFSVKNTNSCSSPVIKEFLLYIAVGKFVIYFLPSNDSHIAFVNAIEVFLSPESFVPGSATLVNASGGNSTFKGLLSDVLRTTVYRINVGGDKLTYENDTMGRTWVPDDAFLITPNYLAQNTPFFTYGLNYYNGGATEYDAPDLVYKTAKEMNVNTIGGSNFSKITWRFNVSRNASHFVRVHFCDIISISPNTLQFYLYVNSKFREIVNPFSLNPQGAAPFHSDFVVESDNSGFIHIALGLGDYPFNTKALLNGLEIMEITTGSVLLPVIKQPVHLLAIVGLVIGGVAFLLLLIGVFVLIWKRRKAKPAETLDWSSRTRTTERTVNGSIVGNLNLGLKMSFLHIQSATNNFDMKLMIGKGGFGRVYKGTLPGGMKVAVKRSDPENGQGLPEFQTEIMVLSKIRHRHLVSLIGYCDERSEMILVYEFMEKGTLRDHLYNWKGDTEALSSVSELSWNRRLEICIGAAKGLHYLHDQGIIHRDIKSTNILLDENYVAKVADFGISRLGVLDQTHVSMEVKGSFGYFDPEYFRDFRLTQKSDVYSFGVVLLEVLCARAAINTSLPREQVNLADWGLPWLRKGQLEKIVDPLLVGKINPNSLRMFGETMEKCLRESGVDRPSMHDVWWDLEYVLQLQQNARHREPHEDSTTAGASWMLPVPAVQQLASESISIDGYDMPIADFSDSTPNSLEVFSLLKADNAR